MHARTHARTHTHTGTQAQAQAQAQAHTHMNRWHTFEWAPCASHHLPRYRQSLGAAVVRIHAGTSERHGFIGSLVAYADMC